MLMLTPRRVSSSIAGNPASVPGTLIITFGRSSRGHRSRACAIVASVSSARSGVHSNDISPSQAGRAVVRRPKQASGLADVVQREREEQLLGVALPVGGERRAAGRRRGPIPTAPWRRSSGWRSRRSRNSRGSARRTRPAGEDRATGCPARSIPLRRVDVEIRVRCHATSPAGQCSVPNIDSSDVSGSVSAEVSTCCSRADQCLDVLVDIPDVDVHPRDDARLVAARRR